MLDSWFNPELWHGVTAAYDFFKPKSLQEVWAAVVVHDAEAPIYDLAACEGQDTDQR